MLIDELNKLLREMKSDHSDVVSQVKQFEEANINRTLMPHQIARRKSILLSELTIRKYVDALSGIIEKNKPAPTPVPTTKHKAEFPDRPLTPHLSTLVNILSLVEPGNILSAPNEQDIMKTMGIDHEPTIEEMCDFIVEMGSHGKQTP